MSMTQQLYTHAKKRIPGGVQLLSKSPNILPVAAVRSSKKRKRRNFGNNLRLCVQQRLQAPAGLRMKKEEAEVSSFLLVHRKGLVCICSRREQIEVCRPQAVGGNSPPDCCI